MRSEMMKLNPEQSFQLSKNQALSLCAGEINISCIYGIIWVTWAGGQEKCLTQGESLAIQSHIKICIQAFTVSSIRLLRAQTRVFRIQHRIQSNFTLDRLRKCKLALSIDNSYGHEIIKKED
jgi:hypothetical protein